MTHPKYIVAKLATFADGKGTAAFQIMVLAAGMTNTVPVYTIAAEHGPNDPVDLVKATGRWVRVTNTGRTEA